MSIVIYPESGCYSPVICIDLKVLNMFINSMVTMGCRCFLIIYFYKLYCVINEIHSFKYSPFVSYTTKVD